MERRGIVRGPSATILLVSFFTRMGDFTTAEIRAFYRAFGEELVRRSISKLPNASKTDETGRWGGRVCFRKIRVEYDGNGRTGDDKPKRFQPVDGYGRLVARSRIYLRIAGRRYNTNIRRDGRDDCGG